MKKLSKLFENNRRWAERIKAEDPDFFLKLSRQQSPEYLWIGCADSRVPANEIIGLLPGEVFVHRNVANLVIQTDLNCMSVIQYAVDVLKVKHIIVCGHYGCGGLKAALEDTRCGLIDNWLSHVKDICRVRKNELDGLSENERLNRLCEINVEEQVINVCRTGIVQDAWKRGQDLSVHGWIYSICDGILKDLNFCISNLNEFKDKLIEKNRN